MTRANLAFMLLASVAIVSPSPGWALQDPQAGAPDRRIRTVAYDPAQVVDIYGAVGAALTVEFLDNDTIQQVTLSDTANLKRAVAGNVLWLKPTTAMPTQPISVRTLNADGKAHLYMFQFQTRDGGTDEATPNTYYLVRFIDPAGAAAARAAQWRQRQVLAREAQARAALAAIPVAPANNRRYIGQGDRRIEPAGVWDDGNSTFFHFPGNVRVPAIFVLNPDGKEATATYTVEGNIVVVHQVARAFRLRDGQDVLCVFNQAFNPVGSNPGTGTTSPAVERTIKGAP